MPLSDPSYPSQKSPSFLSAFMGGGLLILLAWCIYGFYFEEYEGLIALVIEGTITSPPYEIYGSEVLFLILPLLARIADWFGGYPVYGIFHLGVITLYISLFFHLVNRILARANASPLKNWLFTFLLMAAFLGITMVNVNNTRNAILLGASSLLLYIDYFEYDHKKKPLFFFLFLFSVFLRISMAGIVIGLVSVFCVINFRNIKQTFDLLKFHWLTYIVLIILFFCITPKIDSAQQRFEYAQRSGHLVPLSDMITPKDSINYLALTQYTYLSDPNSINTKFVTRAVDGERFMTLKITLSDFKSMVSAFSHTILSSSPALVIVPYVLLLLFLVNADRKNSINTIVFNVASWILILAIAMKLKMEDYVFLPWFAVTLIGSLWLLKLRPTFGFFRWGVFLLALFVIIYLNDSMLSAISKEQMGWDATAKKNIVKFEKLAETQIPVVATPQVHFGYSGILKSAQPQVLKKSIYLSLYFFMQHDFAKLRYEKEYGFSPLDWPGMYLFFRENQQKLSFVMDEQTVTFMQDYYRIMYGLPFMLEKKYPEDEMAEGVFIYKLKN